MFVTPKKGLGQHFLRDKNIARKIVDSLSFEGYSKLIEVGPGTGILTEIMVERGLDVYSVEIDSEAFSYLGKRFPSLNGKIFHADFLDFPLSGIFKTPVGLIGNFPYNISSQIFFKILENKSIIREVVGMVQKEVALRIAEPPGSRIYGITSVLLQAFFNIEYLFSVSEKSFYPSPAVKSAVIKLVRNNTERLDCNEKIFFSIVKTAFNKRRKTLRNSLKGFIPKEATENPVLNKRPEQLGVNEFIQLAKIAGNNKD